MDRMIRKGLAALLCAAMVVNMTAAAFAEDAGQAFAQEGVGTECLETVSGSMVPGEGEGAPDEEMGEDGMVVFYDYGLLEPEDGIVVTEETVSADETLKTGEGVKGETVSGDETLEGGEGVQEGTVSGDEAPENEEGDEKEKVSGDEIPEEEEKPEKAFPVSMNGLYTLAFSGVEPKIQRLDDGSYVAMKGQSIVLGGMGMSSDAKVVSIKKGIGKAKKEGTAFVYFQDGTSAEVRVVKPSLSIKKISLTIGDSSDVSVFAGGAEAKGLKVAWRTSNPNVAQVADGHVVAVGQGSAKIYATIGGKTLKCSVKVSDKPGSTVVANAYMGRKSVAIPVKGAKKETWTVNDSSVVSIVKNSKLTGMKVGYATVSGNIHNILAYIDDPAVEAISLNIKKGEQALIKAGSHAFPIWKSKNPNVAAVSEWGYVIGESDGSTVVSAKLGGKKVKINVMVSGTADSFPDDREYPYVSQVIDGINGNREVHLHYNGNGGYYLHTGDDRAVDPVDPPEPGKAYEENGFTYEVTGDGDAVITKVKEDRITDIDSAYNGFFRLTGSDGKPRFENREGNGFFHIENDSSVANLAKQIEAAGGKVTLDISKVTDMAYDWGVDTSIEEGRAVKTFRKIYIDKDTGWIFYRTDDGKAYIIAHDDEGMYAGLPDSLSDTENVFLPDDGEKKNPIPVDDGSEPNLNESEWHGDEESGDWKRKHVDTETGIVYVSDKDKTGVVVVGAVSPAEDEEGNITVPETIAGLPVTKIAPDAFEGNSAAAEITVTGNKDGKKAVTLAGDFVKVGTSDEGCPIYKKFFHDESVSVLVEKGTNGFYGQVIGAYRPADRITIRKTIEVVSKDAKTVPIRSIDSYAFCGGGAYVSESGDDLYTGLPWAYIVLEDKDATKPAVNVRSAKTEEIPDDYFWELQDDGSYRQMFIDARPNASSTGNRDKGATGYIFYVIRTDTKEIKAVITGYDAENISRYENAPMAPWEDASVPEKVNKTGTMIAVDSSRSARELEIDPENPLFANIVKFDANGGKVSPESMKVEYGECYGLLPVPEREGYDFLGWFTEKEGGTQITAYTEVTTKFTHTAYAHWDPYKVTVKFDANGGEVTETERKASYEQKYGELPVPVLKGHKFEGWYTDRTGGKLVKKDTKVETLSEHVLYARWSAMSYKVTFNPNGGEVSPASKNVTYGQAYGDLPTPSRKGCSFAGWFLSKDGDDSVTDKLMVETDSDHVLYAHWTPNPYTVIFDPGDGDVSTGSKTVYYGDPYGELPVPMLKGHRFDGWFTSETGGDKVDKDTVLSVDEGHVLYAHWTAGAYTVTLDPAGGSVRTTEVSVIYGKAYGTLPEPKRDGYTFNGWFTNKTGGDLISSSDTVGIDDDHTLYAHWSANRYKVAFDSNGGGAPAPAETTVTFGSAYGSLATAKRDGYTLEGWHASREGGEKVTAESEVSTPSDHTLYAHWTANRYLVTFVKDGGSCDEGSRTVTFGQAYGALPVPEKKGHTFNGWFTDPDGGSEVTGSTLVTTASAHSLYARYEANTYKVTFNANGGNAPSFSNKSVVFGQAYGSLPSISRPSYTFDGWFTAKEDGTKVTAETILDTDSDHTLYAHWTDDSRTLYFNYNGGTGSITEMDVIQGEAYGKLPTPGSRAGYEFDGWFTAADGGSQVKATDIVDIPSKTQTLYAHWSAKTFTVTLKTDDNATNGWGNASKKVQVTYGSTYSVLKSNTPSYISPYEFAGWFTEQAAGTQVLSTDTVRITSDQTLYAHYYTQTWKATFDAGSGKNVISHWYRVEGMTNQNYPGGTNGNSGTEPTRTDNYYFDKWNNSPSVQLLADRTFTAEWKKYTKVTFNANGGTVSPSYKYYRNGKTGAGSGTWALGNMPVPEKKGFEFDGWYTAADGGSEVLSYQDPGTSDRTVYAHWKRALVLVDYNYDQNGYSKSGVNVRFQTINCNDTGTGMYGSSISDPTRYGYTFDGWYTSASGGTKIDLGSDLSKLSAANDWYKPREYDYQVPGYDSNQYYLKLYAHWTKSGTVTPGTSEGSYAILKNQGVNGMYLHNVNTEDKTSWQTYGQKGAVYKPSTSNDAYLFQGYYTGKDGGGTQYFDADGKATRQWNQTSDLVLYAKWVKNKAQTLTLNNNGATTAGTASVTAYCLQDLPSITVPKKTGYTFEGYYYQDRNYDEYQCYSASGKSTRKWDISNCTGLYAKWTPNTYNVSLNPNGGSIPHCGSGTKNMTVTYDQTFTEGTVVEQDGSKTMGLPRADRSGYVFCGWFTAQSGGSEVSGSTKITTSNPATLYAHWAKAE